MEKAFESTFFSLSPCQQCWMNGSFFFNVSWIVVKGMYDQCSWTHWRNIVWEIFFPIWNFVFEYLTCYALQKIIIAEVSGHISKHVNIIKVFHDGNSKPKLVTNIHLKTRILLKVVNVFRSDNLTLFMVAGIHSIQKCTKTDTPKQDKK